MFFSSVIEKEFLIKRFNTKYYPNLTIKPHRRRVTCGDGGKIIPLEQEL
jgi:hypothetical protein